MFFVPLHCSAQIVECGVQTSSVASNVYLSLDYNIQADRPFSIHLPNQMTLSVLCVLFSTKNNIYDNILKTTGIEVLCESEIMPPHLIFDVMLKWNYIKVKTIYLYHCNSQPLFLECSVQTYYYIIIYYIMLLCTE